jgi:hypothetical protein
MLLFELTPAKTSAASDRWPAAVNITRDATRPTMVLFLHPRCPCSRATLAEVDRLLAGREDQFSLHIVFVRPPGTGESWEKSSLYETALKFRGAVVTSDIDGVEAARFGATTSGEALLYAADGSLLFHGGVTPSRGHEGDNSGRAALASLISTGRANCKETAVFGCSLINCPNITQTTASHGITP